MFGFLKEKLNNFSEKLKQTISAKSEEKEKTQKDKETKKAPEEKITPKTEHKKPEDKKEQLKEKKKTKEELAQEMEKKMLKEIEEEIKQEDTQKENKQEITGKKEEKIEKKQLKEPETKKTIIEEKETQKQPLIETKKEEKKGLLQKIFSFGKKEEKTKTPEKITEKEIQNTEGLKEKQKEHLKETKEEKVQTKKEKIQTLEEIKENVVLKPEEKKEIKEIEEQLIEEEEETEEIESEISEQEQRMEEKRESLKDFDIKSASEDKRELKAKVGVGGKLSGLIFGGVEIKENEISDLLWELELSLLESDVEQDAAHELVEQIKKRLLGQKVSAKNIDEFLNEQIKEILKEMMTTEKIDLLAEIKKKKEKPYKILLLGPNGAGKTTSLGKLSYLLEKNKLKSIWAAGDTFRAAAIDQLEEHARRLGVRVIKHQYGADPAAVAFDTIKAAEASGIDVVLMDSAGRQETNKNLMEELRKIERVTKPDLKLYVGEAYAGQGLLDQAKEFDEAIGIDGFILTKIDTDAKGGTTISLLYKLKKPILYIGTGQEYKDFEKFSEEYIINRII